MNDNITIGIEGLVGSGKTSLCRELVNMIPNSIILHGGNFYRGIVYALLNSNINIKEDMNLKTLDIEELMRLLKVEVEIKNKETIVLIDKVEINEESLQNKNNSLAVSKIAKEANNVKFYTFARNLIEKFKSKYNVIISGRDLMKIYPDLDYHFFITASLEERVNRKMKQYEKDNISIKELEEHIKLRDKLQEEAGYYNRYDKTIDIDVTDCKNAKESANKVLKQIKINE